MADIRSTGSGPPNLPTAPARPPNAARTAAQRAFFATALGQAQATAALKQPPTPPTQAKAAPGPASPAEAPQRYLRPGSLLDIKV